MPRVTALMPLFNGAEYIRESLESVQNQTYTDWEFIVVNDFGSDDGCADVVHQYSEKDPRIILVQLDTRLGLAASLNVGLDMARGEYIARVDVDDPSEPERFAKQVIYLDEHPEITLCSCYCKSITVNGSNQELVPTDPEELKAAMLFPNEIRHFGTMLRKSFFDSHNLRYDPNYIVEDYELWTRALMEGALFANLPEVLVTHRWGFGNVSISKGPQLEEESRTISKRILQWLGVDTDNCPPELLSGWRARPSKFAKANTTLVLQRGYELLNRIISANDDIGYCNPFAMRKIMLKRWDWIRQSCGFIFTEREYGQFDDITVTPIVTIVLPTYNSASDVSRAIDSAEDQTFTDWEMLVVNDCGSDDGTAEIVAMYSLRDSRIRMIQAEERLGLAESLNLGMKVARGEYIARMDADDTSMPERFAKQVAFLNTHPEVGICGAWQHHYGKNTDWVHQAAPDPKVQRCRLLFWCDLCHSTLMLRRSAFIDNGLFYDPDAQAEDFELWTRAMEFMEIANIPEVLGDYREGTGITADKVQLLADESGRITAHTVKRVLGLELPIYDCYLLNGWKNPISNGANRESDLERLKEILTLIWERNQSVNFFDSKILLRTLAAKWHWTKDNADWKREGYNSVNSIEDALSDTYEPSVLERYKAFRRNNPSFSIRVKKIIKRILRGPAKAVRYVVKSLMKDGIAEINRNIEQWTWDRFQRTNKQIEQWTWDRFQRTNKQIEQWTWDRFQRTDKQIEQRTQDLFQRTDKRIEHWTWERYQRLDQEFSSLFPPAYIPYYNGKIRVIFLFQVASFWPAQESIYHELLEDERFDVRLVCYDEPFDKTIKTETAREFLENHNYEYIDWKDFNIEEFNPHIAFVQTVYDTNRRALFKSRNMQRNGIRVIYIPYGIEIADTSHAHIDHFGRDVVKNSWKIYTFSERMRQDYQRYLPRKQNVCALGLPRFDALFHRERFPQLDAVTQGANGRKIVLWKVHFPKVIKENGKTIMVTPHIQEYIAFAERLHEYQDLFFVFMPHPRFKEFNDDPVVKQELDQLYALLLEADNVYIDANDDYRNSLLNADCIIIDRSAVMVEAGCVGVPVLYMYNPDFEEPLTEAVKPLIDSYYQGTTCGDMESFLAMCRRGEDPLKELRNAAFAECIPYFDGKCGERIKEDIIRSLEEERNSALPVQLAAQNAVLEERISRLEQELMTQMDKSVEHWTWDRFQRTDKQIESWTWNRYMRTQEQFAGLFLDMHREQMWEAVSQSPTYDLLFYLDNRYGSINSAQRILYTVLKWLPHRSVVDFGCGSGTWLWVAQAFGAEDILGIDGNYVPKAMLMIPESCFMPADLEHPIALQKRYDLAMSLEVAEHLAPEAAESFVKSLCDSADIVLFSAAHPGQGGDHHINEQPVEYWIDKFAMHDYQPIEIRQYFRQYTNIKDWYKDNIILFVTENRHKEIQRKIADSEINPIA